MTDAEIARMELLRQKCARDRDTSAEHAELRALQSKAARLAGKAAMVDALTVEVAP